MNSQTTTHSRLSLVLIAALALTLSLAAASPAAALQQKLVAPDGATNAQFALPAIDGDALVVGAPGDSAGRGALYVFRRTGDSWTFSAKLTASDGAPGDALGSSLGISGDTIVAGAPAATVGMNANQGAVYAFTRAGATARTQFGKLIASDGGAGDQFGRSVAIDGDTIVAGATNNDIGNTSNQGAAYTFTAGVQTAKLTASDGAMDYGLGSSAAIDGDTIVVGASQTLIGGHGNQGAAYTFTRTGGNRTQTAKLIASDGEQDDFLANSVAIDGDTIVVGAAKDKIGNNNNQGSVYTFTRAGGNRTQSAKLTASDGATFDQLGYSVAIAGNTILAGAPFATVGPNAFQGASYSFTRAGAAIRSQAAKLTDPDPAAADLFGAGVAIDGDTTAIGSYGDDVGGVVDRGSVTVSFTGGPVAPGDATPPGGTPTPPTQSTRDTTPPDTTGLKGPKKVKRGKPAKFSFGSSEPRSTFLCRVDKKLLKACSSPSTVATKRLKPGKHKFSVAARDAAGNIDPTPAQLTFNVTRKRRKR